MKKLFTLIIMAGLAFTTQAQNITNTLGTDGKLEVKTSGGVEALTVTDISHVIISDEASPTVKTGVILDLNSASKTLQLPMIDPNIWIVGTTHDAGRIFWNTGGSGSLELFYGTGITDFANILDSRSGIASLKDVSGNTTTSSIYIGLEAATDQGGPNNNDFNNVAFGTRSLYQCRTADGTGKFAEENTAIGAFAGYDVTTGQGNTALGYQAGPASGSGTINFSTAIGYGAKTDASDQLVLGRAGDPLAGTPYPATQVVIPGKANIRDVLNLKPMSAPASGEVGDIYFDSGTSKVMVCITAGTPGVWEALN